MKTLITLIVLAVVATSASAGVLYSESFDTFTGWTQYGTVGTIDGSATGLTGFGIADASGNAATATDQRSGAYTSAGTLSAPLAGSGGGTVYVSYLLDVAAVANWGGPFHVGLNVSGGSAGAKAPIVGAGVTPDGAGGLLLSASVGTGADAHTTAPSVTGNAVSLNSTYLVVMKFDWLDTGAWQQTPNGLTVSASIFSTLPSSEGAWDITATSNKVYPFQDPNSILNQVYVSRGASSVDAVADEIRIGDTWNDVVAIPEPATFGLLGLGTLIAMMVRRNHK